MDMELIEADELEIGDKLHSKGVKDEGFPNGATVKDIDDAANSGTALLVTMEHKGREYPIEMNPTRMLYRL